MTNKLTTRTLVTHSFATTVFTNVYPVTSIGRQIVESWSAGKSIELHEYPTESYPNQVLDTWTALFNRVSMLEKSQRLATSKPSKRLLNEIGIDPRGWVDYHYAVYAVGLTSTADLALLLIEAVFALGIPKRFCTMESVLKNRWVRKSAVPNAFSTFEQVLKQHREARNLYLHRGAPLHPPISLPAADWRMLGLVSHSDRGPFAAEYEREIQHMASALHTEFERFIASLLPILDALEPEYNQRLQDISPADQ